MCRSVRFLVGLFFVAGLSGSSLFAGDFPLSISLMGSLTTGSQVFPNPNAINPIDRSRYYSLDNITGYGLELRYRFPESEIAIGLSAEHLKSTVSTLVRRTVTLNYTVEEGYEVFPVELTGYFLIPLSGPTFGVFMGGGVGAYFGERIYEVAGVAAPPIQKNTGFGIHVLGGVSYRFFDWLSVAGEMKFRDLQFETTNAFDREQIIIDQGVINLPQQPFTSRVHTNGVIFQLGVHIDF